MQHLSMIVLGIREDREVGRESLHVPKSRANRQEFREIRAINLSDGYREYILASVRSL